MERAFMSWSGGKDCCLACYRAITSGLEISYLMNMVSEDGQWSRSHGVAAKWLKTQAKAIGIPLMQRQTNGADYEAEFKSALLALKQKGVTAGVFGDIDFNEHYQWIKRVCSEVGIVPHLPLWEEKQDKLLKEFVDLGFKAVVVATRADLLGEEWVGLKLDSDFLAGLAKRNNITPCGEAGEYHTLVIDGPLFHEKLEIVQAKKVSRDGHWFLDIVECRLSPK